MRSTSAVATWHRLAMTAVPSGPIPWSLYTADFIFLSLRISMRVGSTRSGWSWLQARTARCSTSRSGRTSVATALDIGCGPFCRFRQAAECTPFSIGDAYGWLDPDNLSVLNSQNAVAMFQRARTMGDNKRRAAAHEALHGFHYGRLGLHVHGTGRFVEDEHGRILEKRARDGNALALASRKAHTPFTYERLVPLRQANDEVVRVGGPGGGDDFIFARSRPGVGDILGDARREENRLLQDDGELVAQIGQVEVAQICSIQENLARGRVIETSQQIHQRGLAGAGGPGDAKARARFDFKRNVAQDRPVLFVSEGNVAEPHRASGAREWTRAGFLDDIRRFVEQSKSPFGAREMGLHGGHFLADGFERSIELRDQAHDINQIACCQFV